MPRIPPSEHICQAISDYFSHGVDENRDLKSTLILLGAQRLVQELLEEEVTDFLGREHYERRGAGQSALATGTKNETSKRLKARSRWNSPSWIQQY